MDPENELDQDELEVKREESPQPKTGLSETALNAIKQYSMLQRFRQERRHSIDYTQQFPPLPFTSIDTTSTDMKEANLKLRPFLWQIPQENTHQRNHYMSEYQSHTNFMSIVSQPLSAANNGDLADQLEEKEM